MPFSKMVSSSNRELLTSWYSMISYSQALELQNQYRLKVRQRPQNIYLMGLEHQFVITLGRRALVEKEISWSKEKLQLNGAEVVITDRGGLATLHSPGQLVIYPIFSLENYRISVKSYVDLLLKVTQNFLLNLGIESFTQEDQPGLFTKNGKIVFIGLRIRDGICYHGLSINIANDLSLFESIQSCGVFRPRLDQVLNYEGFLLEKGFAINQGEYLKIFFQKWSDVFSGEFQKEIHRSY